MQLAKYRFFKLSMLFPRFKSVIPGLLRGPATPRIVEAFVIIPQRMAATGRINVQQTNPAARFLHNDGRQRVVPGLSDSWSSKIF